MPTDNPSDDARGGSSLVCDWHRRGVDAASVQASGRLNVATSPDLDRVIAAALREARLVLLNMRHVSVVDGAGVQVIVDASVRARAGGRRLVVAGASPHVAHALDGALAESDWLQPGMASATATAHLQEDAERGIRPLANPVNVWALPARVMALPEAGLWLHDADGHLHCGWVPQTEQVAHGTSLEVYLDARGAINGWRDPRSGLAINQRHLDQAQPPAIGSDLSCHGPCGVVWRAPAAAQVLEHDEGCLTCAGTLVLS